MEAKGIEHFSPLSNFAIIFLIAFFSMHFAAESEVYADGNIKNRDIEQNITSENKKKSWIDNLRLSGFIDTYGSTSLDKKAGSEHTKSLHQRTRVEAQYTLRDSDKSDLDFLKTTDPYLFLSAESDYLWFGEKNSYNDYNLDIYEAFLHWDYGPLQLRLGKQNVRWGKTDQLSPVDNINAQDFRQFVLLDLEDRKIPNWLARLRFFHQDWILEGVFIPFFEADELDYFGTDWAVYRQAKQDVQDSGLPAELKRFVQGLDVKENEPSNTLKNSSFGTRLSTSLANMDVAASWLYTRERMPHFRSFPVQNLHVSGPFSVQDLQDATNPPQPVFGEDIHVEYPRTTVYGLEFESVLQEFGIRGEAAYFDKQSFLQQDLTSTRKEVLHVVAGMDYNPPGWYANIQISEQRIFDYQDQILFFDRHNLSVMAELSRQWARGRWEVGLQGIYYFTDKSWHANPELTHSPVSALDISLGLHLLQGARDTILGQFRNNDQLYLRVKYHF
jgi:hypothetical protein